MLFFKEDNPLLDNLTPELRQGVADLGGSIYQTGGSLRDSFLNSESSF